ncbi:NAD(P)/FAD-dependent oxidoreductase [Exiguobacterium indicum]|uniref:NAD(P)/FAD-dependent oxidoreductase n=1 Tax=Exiguobacterium indicum TaxID=296995 RepID=UPI002B25B6D6|nr:FAD-dependent oxidoreductase [Exiguobacterium indicum]
MYTHIIIGAGILGASTAYHLSKAGERVLLVDRKEPGRASHAAAGIICPWMTQRRNKAWYKLANNGAHFYKILIPELEALGETSTGYQQVGTIALHETSKIEKMETIAQNRFPEAPAIERIERLDQDRVKTLFPLVEQIEDALFVSGGARVDGRALCAALIRGAVEHGATVLEGDASLIVDKGVVTGITMENEQYSAEQFILTAGVWLNDLLRPLELKIDLHPEKGQILQLDLTDSTSTTWPVVMGQRGLYLVSIHEGKLIVGSTHEKQTDYDLKPTVKGMYALLNRALPVLPRLEETTIDELRIGLRPYTKNSLPVIGPLQNHPNVFLANGLGASGLTIGPYLGSQLAKLARHQAPDIEWTTYEPTYVSLDS